MQGAWVRSLVGELRSHMPCGMAKKKKKKRILLLRVSQRQTFGGTAVSLAWVLNCPPLRGGDPAPHFPSTTEIRLWILRCSGTWGDHRGPCVPLGAVVLIHSRVQTHSSPGSPTPTTVPECRLLRKPLATAFPSVTVEGKITSPCFSPLPSLPRA